MSAASSPLPAATSPTPPVRARRHPQRSRRQRTAAALLAAAAVSSALVAPANAHHLPPPPPPFADPQGEAATERSEWLAAQREAFPDALRRARRGDRGALTEVDGRYIIYPYLEAAWLGASLEVAGAARVTEFLDRHGDLRPARALRYRWLVHLAGADRWQEYVDAWSGVSRPDTVLRCHYVNARIRLGEADAVREEALSLWLVGRSQPRACDPVFAHLRQVGALDRERYRARIDLALEAREYGLATYLARSLGGEDLARVGRWRTTARTPHSAFARDDLNTLATAEPDWLYLAFDRLAVAHVEEAAAHWQRLRGELELPPATVHAISRRLALSFARDLSPRAAMALDSLDALDAQTAAWRARTAMRQSDWPALLYAVAQLPAHEQDTAPWQYWRGRALDALERPDEARAALAAAAADRSYHGFLAADRIDAAYAFAHRPAQPLPAVQARLAALPAVRRAHELWRVGEAGDAAAEWQAATAPLDASERVQAALLAHAWGWHPSAIATAARAALWDDLELRFPTPYRDNFERWASRTGLPVPFTLGIARSESLFLPNAVSPAGAVGLMQLMPTTGRGVARRVALDWEGRSTLVEPDANIALGSTYLSEVMTRLDRHPALAAAAYNAGEHRVNAWLPRERAMDADAWVDSVPFRETRRYVQRVLMAQAIYDWRLAGRGELTPAQQSALPPKRLSEHLPPVPTHAALTARADSAGP